LTAQAENVLYYGDNLDVLRQHVKDESVDLVYLDPPFNSNASYNVLFAEQSGERSAAQIRAFEDTWRWDQAAAASYQGVVEAGGELSTAMQAFRTLLGDSNMLAYLAMMAPRLGELHRALKPTGSLYLHCDPTASHYLKLLLDSIFGPENFRSEIIWSYKRYTAASNRFQRLHDTIFFYAKSPESVFNDIREPYGTKSGKADSHYKQDDEGRWYRWQKRKGQEPYKLYLSEGRRLGDVWEMPIINASARERLGYPTQKPEQLLERIIEASSSKGQTVLDPFAGCGTTIAVAERMGRRWIGIDLTYLATSLIKGRLKDTFDGQARFRVVGEPVTIEDAAQLAQSDQYQFQWWALGLVGARPAEEKKGGDKGIDGRILFHDEPGGTTKQIILSVKAGKTGPAHVRELIGTVEQENANIGALITFQEPTQKMTEAAWSAGFYTSPGWGTTHPRIQLLTVEQLLTGKEIDYPHLTSVTFNKAPKSQPTQAPAATLWQGAE